MAVQFATVFGNCFKLGETGEKIVYFFNIYMVNPTAEGRHYTAQRCVFPVSFPVDSLLP